MKRLKRFTFILKFWKFIPFLKDFFLSKDVERYKKIVGVLLIVGYAFFPFDLIPDFISLVGIIDDAVVIAFVLECIVKMAPPSLKEKYHAITHT